MKFTLIALLVVVAVAAFASTTSATRDHPCARYGKEKKKCDSCCKGANFSRGFVWPPYMENKICNCEGRRERFFPK